jgi:phosphoglycerate kinase
MKTIRDLKIKGKKVIIRCDFNVPMKNGIITDDNRIKESLETINYAIDKGAKVILMSHLGRVETIEDKKDATLLPVANRLSELLERNVLFIKETRGQELETAIERMQPKEVILMENTRFEDIEGKKESKNDPELGTYWASLGDLYVNDAFGTSHRSHASNVGIATHLESAVGFLIEKELKYLNLATKNPKKPMTVILGGAKVSDKIGVISNLVNVADYILIGGGMSYTFLKAKGYNIGKSLLDEDSVHFCRDILAKYPDKIILPVDVVATDAIKDDALGYYSAIDSILEDHMGVDIGTKTIELFKEYLNKSKTIVWNGPLGVFEIDTFAVGTKEILEHLTKLDAVTIIGGGDTASAAINFGYKDKMTHISTGGGASLELLEGKELPGIKIIK